MPFNALASFTFLNSRNALEDTLRMAIGLLLGYFWGNADANTSIEVDNSIAKLLSTRVSLKHAWAVVYIVPEVYTILLLVHLLRNYRLTTTREDNI